MNKALILLTGLLTFLAMHVMSFACPGDANNDKTVDITDLQYIYDYICSGGPEPVHIHKADANGDYTIDENDADYILEYLFSGGPNPECIDEANLNSG